VSRLVRSLAAAGLAVACAQHAPPIGPAAAPAQLAVDVYGAGPSAPAGEAPRPVAFRVLAADGDTDPGRVVAEGRTGEGAVSVPAGVVAIAVALDPPERVGPFRLEPGASAHVRILDTLDAALPSRIWRIERGDEAVGRAFPPPDELPARTAR
jgi:hypothetical protein